MLRLVDAASDRERDVRQAAALVRLVFAMTLYLIPPTAR